MTIKDVWNMTTDEIKDLVKIMEPYDENSVDRLIEQLIDQYSTYPASQILNILFDIQNIVVLPDDIKVMLDDTIYDYDLLVNYDE